LAAAITMKKILLLLIIPITTINANCQDILGKWYGVGRNHLVEFSIEKDSIKAQILDSREAVRGHEREKIKHFGIYGINDKQLIVVLDKKTSQYLAMTFCNIKDNFSIELAANGVRTPGKTIDELIELTNRDTAILFGNIFFSKHRIQEMEKLKNLETMPLDDFKIFLKMFLENRSKYSYKEQSMPKTFREQIVNMSLIELGYNPIFKNEWENIFLEKYLSDKEVEELWRKY
jgi:hypothetical protein